MKTSPLGLTYPDSDGDPLDELVYTTVFDTVDTLLQAAGLSTGSKKRPAARLRGNANQAIPNATFTALALATVDVDSETMWSAAYPTRLTCKVAGVYVVGASVYWASAAGSQRQLLLMVNGATVIARGVSGTSEQPGQSISTCWPFAVGDYLEAYVYQDSGAGLNALSDQANSPTVWARL